MLAGTSGSRRDQPIEFKESRKDVEAMSARVLTSAGSRLSLASLYGVEALWVQHKVCMLEQALVSGPWLDSYRLLPLFPT